MRRLTILLAAVAALMLVPAQAFAAVNQKVNIVGTGSGEVIEEEWELEGSPRIACKYNGVSTSGVCENEPFSFEPEEPFYTANLVAIPAPGSEFSGWTVQSGTGGPGFCPAEGNPMECVNFSGNEGEFLEATATFTKEAVAGPELTVVKEGTGSGTVVSSPAGIECGGTCKASFETNQKVTLTASPSAGSLFVSWKGCEVGGVNGRECKVTMDKAKSVTAKFIKAYDVTVNRVGTGLGKVSSTPGGVLCLSNCASTTTAFKEGTSVTLTAAPSKNYAFTEWTGDCSGSSTTCSLSTLSANKTVGAKFTAVAQRNLTVNKSGGGNGTVKSNLAGINCGATCSSMTAAYFQGQEVELTATPGKGSSFGGWSGECSGTGTCKVAIGALNSSVAAEFK